MLSTEKKQVLDLFTKGRTAYKLMNFEEALKCFEEALVVLPSDGPSRVYLDRCKHYIQNPPPEDWDGVFIMETK